MASELEFTGKERDAETGLDYFGARYMSSAQGRFTSPDPFTVTPGRVIDPQQLNLYAYARNNPLKYVDPTGMIIDTGGLGGKGAEKVGGRAEKVDRGKGDDRKR